MTGGTGVEVRLTLGAENDLEALYRYAVEPRSAAQAADLLDEIQSAIETLASFPNRGATPQELAILGVREYRQIIVSRYRIIYRVLDGVVYVLIIADGRRDMQSLLERRLLDPPMPP